MTLKSCLLKILSLIILVSASQAQAQENTVEKHDSTLYAPEYCQFMAQFPEEPYRTRKCEGDTEDTCFDLVSYTKVFELSSTVSVNIICNPATPEMYKYFTTEVMEKTVQAMTEGSIIETFNVNSEQRDNYRLASLVGKGKKGLDESIYIAQLWVSDKSIMSVEAELSGEERDDANQLFAELLRNIGHAETLGQEKPE